MDIPYHLHRKQGAHRQEKIMGGSFVVIIMSYDVTVVVTNPLLTPERLQGGGRGEVSPPAHLPSPFLGLLHDIGDIVHNFAFMVVIVLLPTSL